jgi:hypothetical protein
MEARDNPSNPSGAWNRMQPVWSMIDDILAGPATVRARKTTYLPKHEAEEQKEYDRRVSQAPWLAEFEDILRTLASKPFGKEIMLGDGASPRIKDLAEDIDGKGNNLTAFARPVFAGGIARAVTRSWWTTPDGDRPARSLRSAPPASGPTGWRCGAMTSST